MEHLRGALISTLTYRSNFAGFIVSTHQALATAPHGYQTVFVNVSPAAAPAGRQMGSLERYGVWSETLVNDTRTAVTL